MAKREIKKGARFERLTFVREIEPIIYSIGSRQRRIICICICGNEKEYFLTSVLRGNTKSCGCLQRELAVKQMTTHGESCGHKSSPEYYSWVDSKRRCEKKDREDYKYYGGRGIKHKLNSVLDIINTIGHKPSKNHSLDRINNEGHYEIGNIRWATKKEQQRNNRNNRLVTYKGQTRCVAEWVEELKLNRSIVINGLNKGLTLQEIIIKTL